MPRRRRGTPGAAAGRSGVFVDSGAWLALLSRRDRRHPQADAMFRAAFDTGCPLMTTDLVIAEVHRLLLFRAGIAPAARAVDSIDASARVRIRFSDSRLHRGARDWIARLGDQQITYTDAVSFALIRAEGCRIAMSFDRDFVAAGFDLWPAQ